MQSCDGEDLKVVFHSCHDGKDNMKQLNEDALLCINNVEQNTLHKQFSCTDHKTGFQMPIPDDKTKECVMKHVIKAPSPPECNCDCSDANSKSVLQGINSRDDVGDNCTIM